jgi:hypothetical protein
MTLEVEIYGHKSIIPRPADPSQPGFTVETGPNRCHRINFFSLGPNEGGYYQVREFTPQGKSETTPIPVKAGEDTSVENYDGEQIQIRGL